MADANSSHAFLAAEAKKIIAIAIENAIKHLSGEEDKIAVADYWPLGEDVNEQTGGLAIEAFVKEWARGNEWKYYIQFLGQTEPDKFQFEVRWSIPTRRKPIPRATASVYFTLWAHNMDEKVSVFYVFEGHRLVHRPGQPEFREVWLKNIIDNKMKVLETLSQQQLLTL